MSNMSNKSTKNEGIQANNIKAEVIAVGANAHAEQHKYVNSGDFQNSLDELVKQLREALAQIPQEKADDVEVVGALTEELVQAGTQEKPNRKLLEIKGENLKAAAQNLADIAPTVLLIATQIIGQILTLGR